MTSHEYSQCENKRKLRYIEISARKMHLSAVMLDILKQKNWIPLFF